MSLIKAIKAQLGLSVTPANNFQWDASANDGTLTLKRADGTVILKVETNGSITIPAGVNP